MTNWDDLNEDEMRRRGSLKWSAVDGQPISGHWVAEMDFATSPQVATVLHEAVENGLLGYIPRPAAAAAKAATADMYSQLNWHINDEDVWLVSSVLEGLRAMLRTLLPPDSTVVVPTPAYMPFLSLPQLFGHRVRQVPSRLVEGQWELDFDALETAATDAQMLILCNPWNPTGRVLTEEELRQVEQIATRHGLLVFADEIHCPLVFDPATHIPYASLSEAAAAHTVTAVSASKGYNVAGLQCAQVVVTDAALQEKWREADRFTAHPGTLGVLAVPAAYRESGAWLAQVKNYLQGNIELIEQVLDGSELSWARPQSTYLGWIDAAALGDKPAQRILERTGVRVNCGSTLGTGYERFIRFNFASSREVVGRSLDRITALLG
ncbi:MAG: aminotransferase class I/II-fold pyridoxal phosphate-dependent enzyme [Actinomycetaceae bacterium]|nr:aminotransferase class I/II-fold pyridoxal phosphate-dependent enzyme [Actinomycetaceae bacterium]